MAKLKMPATGLQTNNTAVAELPDGDEQVAAVESSADVATALLEGDESEADVESVELDDAYLSGIMQESDSETDSEAVPQELAALSERLDKHFAADGDPDPTTLADPEIADADVSAVPSVEGEVAESGKTIAADEAQQDQPGDGETVAGDSASVEVNVTTSNTSSQSGGSDRLRAFIDWQDRCDEAKNKFVTCALAHAELKAATKAAKVEEEDAMEEYSKILKQNPLYNPSASSMNTRPVATPRPEPTETTAAGQEAVADQGAVEAAPQEPIAPVTDWQSTPITALSDLSEKLIERLQEDGINTIGQLEARRGEISEGKAKWPKGIGEVKITAIEDAVIDWLSQNRDRQVFADLESGHASEQLEQAEQVEQPEALPQLESEQPASEAAAAEVPSVEYLDAINARAIEIDTGEDGCLDEVLKAGYWDRGFEHYQNGGNLATCGLPASPAQDDFIRGWLAAGKVADYDTAPETSDDAQAIPVGASSSANNLPQLVGLDEI